MFVVKKTYPTSPEKDWEKKFDNFVSADDEFVSQSEGHEGGEATLTMALRLEDGRDATVEDRHLS